MLEETSLKRVGSPPPSTKLELYIYLTLGSSIARVAFSPLFCRRRGAAAQRKAALIGELPHDYKGPACRSSFGACRRRCGGGRKVAAPDSRPSGGATSGLSHRVAGKRAVDLWEWVMME